MKRNGSEMTSDLADQQPSERVSEEPDEEEIDPDDLCAICHLILYKPATTRCRHTLCEFCMARWADVSISSQITIVDLDDQSLELLPNEIETRCPMCRTLTTAAPDQEREARLRTRYPRAYSIREQEEEGDRDDSNGESIETLTLYIGNEHRLIRPAEPTSGNRHDWKFFVRPSRTDLVEEVQIFLHPTFRNPRVIMQYPPYEIRRLGWGFFTIYANIILKAGYSWLSSEAEDAPDGGPKGKLPLEWTLSFAGRGRQGRWRLKVRKEKEGQEREDAAQREAVRRLWMQQHETDPDWEE